MDERRDERRDERDAWREWHDGRWAAWQEWHDGHRDPAGEAPRGAEPAGPAGGVEDEPAAREAEPPERRPWTVDVPGVVGATVLLALAAVVGAREVAGVTWDWRWSVTGVLLVAGLAVVLASAATALAGAVRGQRGCGQRR
ncbi:hypothetical protein [Kineococcus terrestris]|uniref:hypothetical protein n=1 Tax=Kineococcus terrestris TaxID=2044856 RepID=UPI0034DB4C89